jgi:RecB family exonuclease
MARKPTLSPTKLSTFLACPTKYYWTYVSDRGRYYLRSKSYFSFGTSLHGALQRFFDEGDAGVRTIGEAVAALEEGWIEAGYSSPEEAADAMGDGKKMIEAYLTEFTERPMTAKTILIEKQLRLDLGEFALIGRVDRVDQHDDGTLEVIDYKSGRQEVLQEDVAQDLAMGLYQLLLANAYPGHPVRATIVALRTNAQASAALSDEELAQLREDLTRLATDIFQRSWDPLAPVAKDLCPTCDFLPLCRQHGLEI